MPFRVSVTTLEKFRRCLKEETSFDTEEALLESIKGVFLGTTKTLFGGAYHKIIEGDYQQEHLEIITADNCWFTLEQAEPALQYRRDHPLMHHEINIRKLYSTRYFDLQITGRVDSIEGLSLRDAKAKFRAPDFEEYMDSCQWKFYLDMMEADVFYYDVFQVHSFPEDDFCAGALFSKIRVDEPQTAQCCRYAGMEDELQTIINDFMDYIHDRRLLGYLKPLLNDGPLFL